MGRISGIRRLFRLTGLERGVEGEVADELEFHLESRIEELLSEGHDPDSARLVARREFGDVAAARAELTAIDRRRTRRESRRNMLDDVGQDVRLAVRGLVRRPMYAVVAVLMLALGIGAATSIFAVVDAVLLRPFPFPEPDRLAVLLGVAGPERDIRGASYAEVGDWRERSRSFEAVSIYDETVLNLSGEGAAEQLEAEIVSPAFFDLLDARPLLGRLLQEGDEVPGQTPPVVISEALWRERFESDGGIVGRTLILDGQQAVVVGVAEAGFRGLSFDTDIWATLLPLNPDIADSRGDRWLAALARLRPGVTREAAQADLEAVTVALEADYPQTNTERRADLYTLHRYFLDQTRVLMLALLASVGVLLLIACVNVLNLQLVRGLARGQEVAVRYSLGARRSRVIRQFLTESLVLAGLGGVAGLAAAWWGTRALIALVPDGVIPSYAQVALDARVLAVAVSLVAIAGLLSGTMPALRGSRRGLSGAFRSADRSGGEGASGPGFRLQHALVAIEVGLAVALMLGAAVMIRSLRAQTRVDPGFQPNGLVVARVFLPGEVYGDGESRALYVERVLEGLRNGSGVLSVAIGTDAPLRGGSSAAILRLPGSTDERGIRFYRHMVTPDFFDVIGMRIIRGRGFEPTDGPGAQTVAVVSRSFADKVWPGRDGTGEFLEAAGRQVLVVGVAADVRYRDLTTDLMDPGEDPDVWFSYAQLPGPLLDIVIRYRPGAPADIDGLRRVVASIDPTIPLYQVERLDDALSRQTANDRFGAVLLGFFGMSALVLAATGLFGVMSFVVSMRRREIAIRIALGSSPGAVLGRVLRQGLTVVGIGAGAGLLASMMTGRLISRILFGVSPMDPLSIGLVVLLLGGAAAAANMIPAARAARTDPQVVLRGD